ncbi:MAG: N-acyl homoserine lactonase family protein [Chloroflexota bacterium]
MKNSSIERLTVLDFGLFQVHADGRIIGIQGYLIQTQDGKNILVDTGFPAKYAENVQAASDEDGLGAFGHIITLSKENLPSAQLARCGVQPQDIDTLIMSHTHIDHVGGLNDFPQATLVISCVERSLPKPLYWNNHSPIDWPANVQYHLIDQETTLYPGLTLLPTPGHSPGHLSLLVNLPQSGPILLTCDAISRQSEPKEGFDGSWDPIQAEKSAAMLLELADREQAVIIYGHDPEQWAGLRKAPNYYQ